MARVAETRTRTTADPSADRSAASRKTRRASRNFMSLRWRVVLPLLVLMGVAGGLAYLFVIGTSPDAPEPDRQLLGIGMAVASALLTAASFLLINATSRRADRVTRTLDQLSVGQHTVRTGMSAGDEIGRVAEAVDRYADYVQEKRDEMRSAMRKTRREVGHLHAILEALPDGVIVQDNHGRVLLVNEVARSLLGAPRRSRNNAMNELTALVTDQLGPMLSPNLYALGEPEQVELDGRLLHAQAAAVTGDDSVRVGTVIMLRDMTDEIRRDRDREVMLQRMERSVQQPMMNLARETLNAGGMTSTADFARELTRHAFTLQKMIVELRDLGETTPEVLKQTQKPIQLEVLVWSVSNEWRQIAHSCQITMKVIIQTRGLYVLGDDRRLRWAIGNLIDNAIKYTQPGGTVTLEIRGEEHGAAQLRIRDNGVGIAKHEQAMLFTRFWRGTPRTPEGRVVRVPGMGQGLYLARQIIEAHGGTIEIRTRPAVGTAVYFSLPTTASEGFQLPYFTSEMDGETTRLEASGDYFMLDQTEKVEAHRPDPSSENQRESRRESAHHEPESPRSSGLSSNVESRSDRPANPDNGRDVSSDVRGADDEADTKGLRHDAPRISSPPQYREGFLTGTTGTNGTGGTGGHHNNGSNH